MHRIHQNKNNIFLPVFLLGVAFLVLTGFQLVQLKRERNLLAEILANQEQSVKKKKKVREQLEVIAQGTKMLAIAGNENAQKIVAGLQRQGVNIRLSKDSTLPQSSRP